jgi:hypothetical protein
MAMLFLPVRLWGLQLHGFQAECAEHKVKWVNRKELEAMPTVWTSRAVVSADGWSTCLHLAMSGDTFGCHNLLMTSSGWRQEHCETSYNTQDSAHNKKGCHPNISNVKPEKDWSGLEWRFI